ncbi:MAG: Hsp70 family protein, partial [Planctomycetales bacterium]
MSKERAVGIDLGTTYSAMAWVDDANHSALIQNAEGDLLTPSSVLFEDDDVIVGKDAKKLGVYEPARLAEVVKRDMGRPFYNKKILDVQFPPEVIQAFILRKMKRDLAAVAGENIQAVITVPAFFDEPRRKATVDAAMMAG